MLKFILRTAISLTLTYGIWHWYNENVLSKLDVDAQMEAFEEYDLEDDNDNDYAYDDYDNERDW